MASTETWILLNEMRAFIDDFVLSCWLLLVTGFSAFCLHSALPAYAPNGETIIRLGVTLFPLLSAYRLHCAYHIRAAPLWFAGCWIFSLLVLVGYVGQREALLQNTLVAASLLFIALPAPMQRVWGVLLAKSAK